MKNLNKFVCVDCGAFMIGIEDELRCKECNGMIKYIGIATWEEVQIYNRVVNNKPMTDKVDYKAAIDKQIKTLESLQESVSKLTVTHSNADTIVKIAEQIRVLCESGSGSKR